MTETLEQQTMTQSYDQYIGAIEGILFAAGDAVEIRDIAAALSLSIGVVDQIADMMASEYENASRGIRLIRVGGSLQLSTKPILYPYISQILSLRQSGSLSRAALETLSIIAYRQPITRVEIEQIRGVSSASSIKNLLDREMICEAGRKDAPGRPFFYKTTEAFLKAAHVEKLADLPDFDAFMNALIEERVEDAIPGENQASDPEEEKPQNPSQSTVDESINTDDNQTVVKEAVPAENSQTTNKESLPSEVSERSPQKAFSEKATSSDVNDTIPGDAAGGTSVKGLKAFEVLFSTETELSDTKDSDDEVSDEGQTEEKMINAGEEL